jgi:hypothetical protein
MGLELLGGEGKAGVRRLVVALALTIVVSIDDELPFGGNRLVGPVVQIDAATEASNGRLANLVEHCRRPDHDHFHGRGVFAFLQG